MMNSDAPLPYGSEVVVTNASLKTYGKVFTVGSFSYDNRFKPTVDVEGHGLAFKIKKSNIALVSAPVKEPAIFIPEPVAEPLVMEYRVANTANSILKDVFTTVEAAEDAIRKWAGGLNQQIEFQILTVVKSYKANREIVLEAV